MNILNRNSNQYDNSSKNEAIIQAFDSLDMGDKFIVKSDSDLNSVHSHLDEERMNVFNWEYLEEGPNEWEAKVSKRYYNYI